MIQPSYDIVLSGCRPEPLAAYLKALGVLRLVAEQRDPEARGWWRGDAFMLRSRLTREDLIDFFVDKWQPTPIVAPWNGASGFWPKDNRQAADAIVASANERLRPFAAAIEIGRTIIAEQQWQERPSGEHKMRAVAELRARLPDMALAWVDAAVVMSDDRLMYPPLLGTGGNDGHLDFSNNYQQRVVEVLTSGDIEAPRSGRG